MDLEFNHIKNHFLDEAGEGPAGGSGDGASAAPGGQDAAALSDRGPGGADAGKTPTVESLTAELATLRKDHEKLTGDHKQLQQKWTGKVKGQPTDAFRKGKLDDAAAGEGDGAGGDGKSKGKGADGKTAGGEPDGAEPESGDDFDEKYAAKESKKAFDAYAESVGATAEEALDVLVDISAWRHGNLSDERMLELSKQLTTGRFHEAILEKALKENTEKVRLETMKQVREDIRTGRMPLQASAENAASAAPDQNMERAKKALQELS